MSHYELRVVAIKKGKIKNEPSVALLFEDHTWSVIFNRSMFIDERVFDELDARVFLDVTRDEANQIAEEYLTKTKYVCTKW